MDPQKYPGEAGEYLFVTTEDGSRSLRISKGEGLASEAMHSLKGAFSETEYIYGTAMRTAFEFAETPHILSMGLGLGYNEILATGLALQFAKPISGESFEIVADLRNYFLDWACENENVPSDFATVYDDITARTATLTAQSPALIRKALRESLELGRWKIREALTAETEFANPFTCICFDAFSSKSTPELWSEEFLMNFLDRATGHSSCVLSTYACTGALKRSLKSSGFDLQIREGFSSKRDSTFAVRQAVSK